MTIHVKRYPEMFTHLDMSDPESFPEFLKVTGIIPDSQSRIPLSGMWNDLENTLMEKENPQLVDIHETVFVQEIYGNQTDVTGKWAILTHEQFHFLYRERTKIDDLTTGLASGDHVTFYGAEGVLESRNHLAEARYGEEMWNVEWADDVNLVSPIASTVIKRVYADIPAKPSPRDEAVHNQEALKRYTMLLELAGATVLILEQRPYGESDTTVTGVVFQIGAQRYLASHFIDPERRHISINIVDAHEIEAAYGFPITKDNIVSMIDRVDYPRDKRSPGILYGVFKNADADFSEETSEFDGNSSEDRETHAFLNLIRVLG